MNKIAIRVAMALTIAAVFGLVPLVAAPQAVLNNLKGKVEVKELNSKTWKPATDGMVLNTLATVSTGFNSSVTIVIDKSTIYVKPLTRMTIDKLLGDQTSLTASCYLRVGSVQASVKSAEGVTKDFKVKSPYSTASVRGTVFDYDGIRLDVAEGEVAFIPGRPQRDIQMPAGVSAPDLSDDFVGAPETPADESNVSFVSEGFSAETDASGGTPELSSDLDKLQEESDVPTSQTGVDIDSDNAGSDGSGYGNLRLTIIVPPAAVR